MKKILILASMSILFVSRMISQTDREPQKIITSDGSVLIMEITETGDTLYIAEDLVNVSVSSPRKFKDRKEYYRYLKFKRYVLIVYPYAQEAIRIFSSVNELTENKNKRKKKRIIKKLQKELKKEFEDPLKHLTRLQGYILVKMIEKELDTPMYDLIKNLRGGFTATYWNTFGKFYGYDLKQGYIPGNDIILDAVLNDFDISYKKEHPDDVEEDDEG